MSSTLLDCVETDMKNNWFGWHTILLANIILVVLGVMML